MEHRRRREGRLPALHPQGDLRAAARHPGGAARPGRRARQRHACPSSTRSRTSCARSSGSTWSAAAPPITPARSGAHLIQSWAGLPANGQIGSEMRYSPPPIDDRTLVISVSQSGETADTLAPHEARLRAGRGDRGRHQRGRQRPHPRGRRGLLPAGRAGGGGGLDQGLRDPGGRAPDDRPPPRPAARDAERPAGDDVRARAARPSRAGGGGPRSSPRRSRSSPSAGAACATSCSSVARSASRSRWRARSSSRSCPTSTPRGMPPAS